MDIVILLDVIQMDIVWMLIFQQVALDDECQGHQIRRQVLAHKPELPGFDPETGFFPDFPLCSPEYVGVGGLQATAGEAPGGYSVAVLLLNQ